MAVVCKDVNSVNRAVTCCTCWNDTDCVQFFTGSVEKGSSQRCWKLNTDNR